MLSQLVEEVNQLVGQLGPTEHRIRLVERLHGLRVDRRLLHQLRQALLAERDPQEQPGPDQIGPTVNQRRPTIPTPTLTQATDTRSCWSLQPTGSTHLPCPTEVVVTPASFTDLTSASCLRLCVTKSQKSRGLEEKKPPLQPLSNTSAT